MDIATLDTRKAGEDGFPLKLRHPDTGDELDITITVKGSDSQTYQDCVNEQQQRRMERSIRRGKMGATPQEVRQEATELLAAVTAGWQGLVEQGAPVPFSTGTATRIYTDYPWIREQVDAAIHNRANFLPRSATA